MTNSIRIHSSITGATTVRAVGEVLISAKWRETAAQIRKERAIVIPMECVRAPEVPESFRPLVEAVLMEAAEGSLKQWIDQQGDQCFEILDTHFSRPALTEFFLQRGEVWLSKEQLEMEFTHSATWKRIVGRKGDNGQEMYKTNQNYKHAAEQFRAAILKLTGKAVQMKKEHCDSILVKLEESDLETPFGCFVVKRLNQLGKKQEAEVSFDDL
jgi:hypothetical protein